MTGWVPVEEAMPAIIKALSAGPYVLGERFSAADVLYGTTFAMFGQSPMMPKSTVIDDCTADRHTPRVHQLNPRKYRAWRETR